MADLKKRYEAILITTGSEQARDLKIPGREASGIYFAMDYLPLQNKIISGEINKKQQKITAKNKYIFPKKPANGGKPTIDKIMKEIEKANAGFVLPKLAKS